MLDLIIDNPLPFVLAFVIGLATAWWIWGRLSEIVSDTVDSATDTVGGVASGAVDTAKGAAGAVGDVASGAAGAAGDVAGGAVDAAKGAGGAVVGGVAAAGAGAAAMASGAKDAVVDTASAAKDAVVDTASGAKDAASDATSKVKGKVQSAAGKPKIAAAVGKADDLTRIKGVGPKLNELCQSLGVKRFDQIAAWSAADVAEVDQYLKIKGRIDRDEWVAQSKLLAVGDDAGHAAKYSLK